MVVETFCQNVSTGKGSFLYPTLEENVLSAKNKLDLEKEVAALEVRLADLKARLPAHSIPPAMMTELDEIEDQLARAKSSLAEANA